MNFKLFFQLPSKTCQSFDLLIKTCLRQLTATLRFFQSLGFFVSTSHTWCLEFRSAIPSKVTDRVCTKAATGYFYEHGPNEKNSSILPTRPRVQHTI